MAGNGIHQDSIGRCDLYSNPYDARLQAKPAIIRQRADLYMKSQDTLSSAQAKMENEIFQKLFGSGDKQHLIISVGKYLFLMIALPPYIFCYGIPKWLLVDGLPKVFHITAQAFRQISNKVRDVAQKFVGALTELGKRVTSPILSFIQTRIEQARELFAHVKRKVDELLYAAAYPLRLFDQKILEPAREFFGELKARWDTLKEKIAEARWQMRSFFVDLPFKVRDKAIELFEKLEIFWKELPAMLKKPFQPLIDWASPKLDAVKKVYEKITDLYRSALDKALYAPLRKVNEEYIKPVLQWVSAKSEALQERWEHLRERVREKVKAISDRVEVMTKSAGNLAIHLGNQIIQMVPQPVFSFFAATAAFVTNRNLEKRARTFLKVQIEKISGKIDSGLRQALQWIHKRRAVIIKAVEKVAEKLIAIPQAAFSWLAKIVHFFLTAFHALFMIFRLMLAWLRALLRYGLHLLKNFTKDLLSINS